MGKKGTSKRRKIRKNMDLSICIFVAFFAFSICFFLLLFCFFGFLPGKKRNKSKKKANRKSKKTATKMQMDKSIVFPCFPLFVFSFCFLVFPFYFAFVFFGFCWFAFCFFHFLLFSRFFSSFKKIRISYGLVNITLVASAGQFWGSAVLPRWTGTLQRSTMRYHVNPSSSTRLGWYVLGFPPFFLFFGFTH